MAKLHQILAVERDIKKTADRRVTVIYQNLGKAPLTQGVVRTYAPKDDEGEVLPPESTLVQLDAATVLEDVYDELTKLFDIEATKDVGNTIAFADVVLEDGTTLMTQVPATYLLWLEKQLEDMHTIASKLPTLDPAFSWSRSNERDCYETPAVQTFRSQKRPKVLVKAAATDKHPAQTEVYHEDETVGIWNTVRLSGALPVAEARALVDRINEVRAAVKIARSKANETEVQDQSVAFTMIEYIAGRLAD